jgi:hypothetical protein
MPRTEDGSDMDIFAIWHWVERIAGILMIVCFCLYAVRCVVAGGFIGVEAFGHFLQGLIGFICS